MKRTLLLLAITFLLIGCNSVYKENLEAADAAMDSGEFEDALMYYNTALEDKPDDTDIQAKISLLTDYYTLQEQMENNEWIEAFDLANIMLKNDVMVPTLEKEVKEAFATIENEQDNEKNVATELKKIEKLIEGDNVESAQQKLDELKSEVESDELISQVDNLYKKLSSAEKRVAKNEAEKQAAIDAEKQVAKKAEEKAKQEAKQEAEQEAKQEADRKVAKETEANTEKSEKVSESQEKYMNKANELDNKRDKTIPNDEGYVLQGEEWHDLLQEVWAELSDTMPKAEFKKLKVEQNEWIDEKDKSYQESLDQIEKNGAGRRPVEYPIKKDAERTFYLIENYLE